MVKCIYCGKKIEMSEKNFQINNFSVCSESCKMLTNQYLKKDKKYKLTLYFIIFLSSLGIIIAAITQNMKIAYLSQLIFGIFFALLPYPISQFKTFSSTNIKSVMAISRIIGILLTLWSIILLIYA